MKRGVKYLIMLFFFMLLLFMNIDHNVKAATQKKELLILFTLKLNSDGSTHPHTTNLKGWVIDFSDQQQPTKRLKKEGESNNIFVENVPIEFETGVWDHNFGYGVGATLGDYDCDKKPDLIIAYGTGWNNNKPQWIKLLIFENIKLVERGGVVTYYELQYDREKEIDLTRDYDGIKYLLGDHVGGIGITFVGCRGDISKFRIVVFDPEKDCKARAVDVELCNCKYYGSSSISWWSGWPSGSIANERGSGVGVINKTYFMIYTTYFKETENLLDIFECDESSEKCTKKEGKDLNWNVASGIGATSKSKDTVIIAITSYKPNDDVAKIKLMKLDTTKLHEFGVFNSPRLSEGLSTFGIGLARAVINPFSGKLIEDCSNGLDDDFDGKIDDNDKDCDESQHCGDGIDNDDDGKKDCADPDCWGKTGPNGVRCCGSDDDCGNKCKNCKYYKGECNNNICTWEEHIGTDEDNDEHDVECGYQCECNDSDDTIHKDATEICTDEIDNDCDDLIDCDDPDCTNNPACAPQTETDCSNEIDDDGDGFIDCEDPDCAGREGPNGKICCQESWDCPGWPTQFCSKPTHACTYCSKSGECSIEKCDYKIFGCCISQGKVCKDSTCQTACQVVKNRKINLKELEDIPQCLVLRGNVTLDCQNQILDGSHTNFPAAIVISNENGEDGPIIIKNCKLQNWVYGILAYYSANIILENVEINNSKRQCDTGGIGAAFYESKDITIINSKIVNNSWDGIGIYARRYNVSNITIRGSTIYYNGWQSTNGGAGISFYTPSNNKLSDITVKNSHIYNNSFSGIYLKNVENVKIIGNNIHDNNIGINVNGNSSGITIIDNIIHRNVNNTNNFPENIKKDEYGLNEAGQGIRLKTIVGEKIRNVTIKNNEIYDNDAEGIDSYWRDSGNLFDIQILQNTLKDNRHGISLKNVDRFVIRNKLTQTNVFKNGEEPLWEWECVPIENHDSAITIAKSKNGIISVCSINNCFGEYARGIGIGDSENIIIRYTKVTNCQGNGTVFWRSRNITFINDVFCNNTVDVNNFTGNSEITIENVTCDKSINFKCTNNCTPGREEGRYILATCWEKGNFKKCNGSYEVKVDTTVNARVEVNTSLINGRKAKVNITIYKRTCWSSGVTFAVWSGMATGGIPPDDGEQICEDKLIDTAVVDVTDGIARLSFTPEELATREEDSWYWFKARLIIDNNVIEEKNSYRLYVYRELPNRPPVAIITSPTPECDPNVHECICYENGVAKECGPDNPCGDNIGPCYYKNNTAIWFNQTSYDPDGYDDIVEWYWNMSDGKTYNVDWSNNKNVNLTHKYQANTVPAFYMPFVYLKDKAKNESIASSNIWVITKDITNWPPILEILSPKQGETINKNKIELKIRFEDPDNDISEYSFWYLLSSYDGRYTYSTICSPAQSLDCPNITLTLPINGKYGLLVFAFNGESNNNWAISYIEFDVEGIDECVCSTSSGLIPCGMCFDNGKYCNDKGEVVDNCTACGCNDGYYCAESGKCVEGHTTEECAQKTDIESCHELEGCYWDDCKACEDVTTPSCSVYTNDTTCWLDPCIFNDEEAQAITSNLNNGEQFIGGNCAWDETQNKCYYNYTVIGPNGGYICKKTTTVVQECSNVNRKRIVEIKYYKCDLNGENCVEDSSNECPGQPRGIVEYNCPQTPGEQLPAISTTAIGLAIALVILYYMIKASKIGSKKPIKKRGKKKKRKSKKRKVKKK